jgi:hypothetical protein
MSTFSFNNIIGPPPQSFLDFDQDLNDRQAAVNQRIRNELLNVGDAPQISDYTFPPTPGAPPPPLEATTVGKNCPEIIFLYVREYSNVRLHPYYTDTNNYLIQRARIFCDNPNAFKTAKITRKAQYKIFYKKITNESYKYYLSPKITDTSIDVDNDGQPVEIEPVSGVRTLPLLIDTDSFLFGPTRGKSRYFNCQEIGEKDLFKKDGPTTEEDIDFYFFDLTAITEYKIFTGGDWEIDLDQSSIEINASDRTNPNKQVVRKTSFKNYSLVRGIPKKSIIPDKILKEYRDWVNKNFDDLFIDKKISPLRKIHEETCKDNCDREIEIQIFQQKIRETFDRYIKCTNKPINNCVPNEPGKTVYGPLQPIVT